MGNVVLGSLDGWDFEELMPDKPFGTWLKETRERRRMSQEEVAAGARVTQAYISKIERLAGTDNEPEVSREVIEGIGRALGVPPDEALMAAGLLRRAVRRRVETIPLTAAEIAEILRRGGGDKITESQIRKLAGVIDALLPLINPEDD